MPKKKIPVILYTVSCPACDESWSITDTDAAVDDWPTQAPAELAQAHARAHKTPPLFLVESHQ